MRNYSLHNLLAQAFAVRRSQIIGPEWMSRNRFDVEAKLSDATPAAVINDALQSLLEDRWALKYHRETKQMTGYALEVGRKGAKLPPGTVGQGMPKIPRIESGWSEQMLGNSTTGEFADLLTRLLHQPVVDMTALAGKYDFTISVPSSTDGPDEAAVFGLSNCLDSDLFRKKFPYQ